MVNQVDKINIWKDAAALDFLEIYQYEIFIDKGHHIKSKTPNGYKKIRIHFVFDVKYDGTHNTRQVADGHLTDIPFESVFHV
jgi:hypothetical protein